VACSQAHGFEVTGSVDLTKRALTDRLQGEQVLSQLCAPLAQPYLGRPLRANERSGWLSIDQESWDAGRRVSDCTAARVQGTNPIEVSGRLREQP
jgi:hypothetical protein